MHVDQAGRVVFLSYPVEAVAANAPTPNSRADLFARVLERHPGKEEELYAAAVDLLVRLHADTGNAQSLPPYDADVYLRESCLLTEWYLPAANGQ
mgnify:CR=1 FL=1